MVSALPFKAGNAIVTNNLVAAVAFLSVSTGLATIPSSARAADSFVCDLPEVSSANADGGKISLSQDHESVPPITVVYAGDASMVDGENALVLHHGNALTFITRVKGFTGLVDGVDVITIFQTQLADGRYFAVESRHVAMLKGAINSMMNGGCSRK